MDGRLFPRWLVVGGLVGGRPVEEGTYGVYHQPHTWQGVGD